jgi:hypothetical protein
MDTLSWFPSKVTMPLASSTDLVLAGINDIVQVLMHLSTNSPLAPPMDSEVQALQDLITLLSNIAAPPKAAPSMRGEPTDTIVLPVKAVPHLSLPLALCPSLFPHQHRPRNPHMLLPMKIAQAPADEDGASRPGNPKKRQPLHLHPHICTARRETKKAKTFCRHCRLHHSPHRYLQQCRL